MYDKNLVHESAATATSNDVTTSADTSTTNHKTTNIHNVYNVEKRSLSSSRGYGLERDDVHTLSREQLLGLREAYSLDELPRVTRVNDHEVQSIDSALLSAEEQDLIDSSIEEERLSALHRSRSVRARLVFTWHMLSVFMTYAICSHDMCCVFL